MFLLPAFILYSACMIRAGILNHQQFAFLLGAGAVFGSGGDDEKFALFYPYLAVAEFHFEPSFYDDEKFVLAFVAVPDEIAIYFGQVNMIIIDHGNHFGGPLIVEQGEFFF